MTPQRLAAIGLVALLAIGAALWLAGQRSLEREMKSAPLYPDLNARLETLERIVVHGPGDTVIVTLDQDDGRWRVLERSGHPADVTRLRSLLRGLADASILEEKTAQPDNYPALGVEDPSLQGAQGVRIVLEGVTPPVDLIVGKPASGRDGGYVRRNGEARSWLIDHALDVPTDPARWIERSLVDASADRIQSVTIEIGASRYDAAKSSRADADFAVTGLPEGRALSSSGAADGLATTLVRLEADDVRPVDEVGSAGPAAHATFRTFDGLVLDLQGYTVDDQRFVAIEARADPELAQRFALPTGAPTEPDGEASGADAGGTAEDTTVATEADAINGRVRGWAYAIPEYKYSAIFRPVDELLAPLAD